MYEHVFMQSTYSWRWRCRCRRRCRMPMWCVAMHTKNNRAQLSANTAESLHLTAVANSCLLRVTEPLGSPNSVALWIQQNVTLTQLCTISSLPTTIPPPFTHPFQHQSLPKAGLAYRKSMWLCVRVCNRRGDDLLFAGATFGSRTACEK